MSALQFVLFGTLLVFSIIQAEQFIDVDSDDTLTDLTEEANFVENERFKKSTNTVKFIFLLANCILLNEMFFFRLIAML